MRVLLIGGTRFIGKALTEQLVEAGHEVIVFHRGEHEEGSPATVRHIHAEEARFPILSYPDEVRKVGPEVVVHMTAYGEADAQAFVEAFAGNAERVVVVSSQDVYRAFGRVLGTEPGPAEALPITEESPLREHLFPYRGAQPRSPDDPQAWRDEYDKILVERVVLSAPDLPATVLRLPAVYGPGDYQHRLWEFLPPMLDGRTAIVLPENYARWRWTRGYVRNVADAIALATTREDASAVVGQVFNVGEEVALSTREWAEAIGVAMGWSGKVIAIPREQLPPSLQENDLGTAQDLVVSSAKLRASLGYRERVPRAEALAASVAWERAHPPEQIATRDYAAEDAVLNSPR